MKNEANEFNGHESDPAVRFLQAITVCFCRMYHQVTVRQRSHVPAHGPAILVCNHTSSLDPLLIQSVCPRLIRWMMAKEYFDYRPLRWVFNQVGVILVERSGRDLAATRAALRALEQGYVLGVFPEGRIETSTEILPFRSGIGLLALRSGAPVLPAFLHGTQRGKDMVEAVILPNTARLAFGSPVNLAGLGSERSDIQEATQRIQEAVNDLKKIVLAKRPRKIWRSSRV